MDKKEFWNKLNRKEKEMVELLYPERDNPSRVIFGFFRKEAFLADMTTEELLRESNPGKFVQQKFTNEFILKEVK